MVNDMSIYIWIGPSAWLKVQVDSISHVGELKTQVYQLIQILSNYSSKQKKEKKNEKKKVNRE